MALSFSVAQSLVRQAHGLTSAETHAVLGLLSSGTLGVEEGAELLRAWAARGETGVELSAAVAFLREHALTVPVAQPCFDLCGTGGSGLHRFNISTTVAFVAAAAGIPVAKHGNRGSKRPNGSFDLLDELGVPFDFSPTENAALQQQTGLCFLFARSHHPEVAKVAPYRKLAGGRTLFNLAGPLSNPARLQHQLIGTVNQATGQVVAAALAELDTPGALVVWGAPGIDEVSITGPTHYLWIQGQAIEAGVLEPAIHRQLDHAEIPGGDAPENARLFHALLDGQEQGPLLDMLVQNAGAAIDLWHGRRPQWDGIGANMARQLLQSGAVQAKFQEHRAKARALQEARKPNA